MDQHGLTVSIEEAGKLLSCGRNLSYRLAREGTIPVLRLGKKMRVPIAALTRMLESAGINQGKET